MSAQGPMGHDEVAAELRRVTERLTAIEQLLDEPLTEREAATLCGISTSYLRVLRREGRGPEFERSGPRARVLYQRTAVLEWRSRNRVRGAA